MVRFARFTWPVFALLGILLWQDQQPLPESFHHAKVLRVERANSIKGGTLWLVKAQLEAPSEVTTVKLSRLRMSPTGRPLLQAGEPVCLASATPLLRTRMYWETVPYKCDPN